MMGSANMDVDDARSVYTSRTRTGSTIYSSMDGTPAPSLYSYRSERDGRAMLRELAGRTLNAANDLYLLPADENEHSRLDKQHLVNLLALGRLYVAEREVQEALSPLPDRPRAILDLGCGGGNWAMGMAQEFPHAQVVGVDLAPTTIRPPPHNCRFEFDDFTLGLEHYYNSFDVVHSRSTANGVSDFEAYVQEAARCVRPGGILLVTEGNLEIQNENEQPQDIAFGEGEPGQSWLARALFEAYNLMKQRGSSVDAGTLLKRLIHTTPELTDGHYQETLVPIGPWKKGVYCGQLMSATGSEWDKGTDELSIGSTVEETQRLEMIGTLMRQNMKEFVRSCKPMFVASGYAPALIERLTEGTDKELDEQKLHMYVKWHHSWGRRVESPNQTVAMDMSATQEVITAEAYYGAQATPFSLTA